MAMYSFRDIPADLWSRFQERLKADGITGRAIGPRLLDIYARSGIERLERTAKEADREGRGTEPD